jgi:hypothetical protein
MLARNSLLARLAASAASLASSQSRLRPLALGDVEERDDRADGLALLADRVGPVFHRKTRAIRAPENFLIRMNSLRLAHRIVIRQSFSG